MKIGIIGTGNMGRTLGVRWAGAGHEVVFGARDRGKAEAAAGLAGGRARTGSLDDAAAFGEVVLYTVRGVPPSHVLRDRDALAGKIVIDCNNSDFAPGSPTGFAPPPVPSYAEQLAHDAPGARVVQAFTTTPHVVLELAREQLAPRRISVFLCGDDPGAKQIVGRLGEDLGLVAVDSGALRDARIVDGVADFIRFHIVKLGRGPYATIALDAIPEAAR
jgi:predicted dinucleotide-binding enzyme